MDAQRSTLAGGGDFVPVRPDLRRERLERLTEGEDAEVQVLAVGDARPNAMASAEEQSYIASMTHNTLDLTGRTFGRLTVVRREGSDRHGKATWFCRCECGGDAVVVGRSLVSGKTQACGCLRLERLRAAIVTHGATREGPRPAEYRIWQAMKTRCRNPNHVYFDRYGGRGIKVCDRWEGSYENFLADMGPRPSSRHSIDRVDNDGDYEPGNCRWATQVEQGHSYRGQESPETRLTEDDVREIRRVYAAGGVSQRALAERYGITGGAIGCIVRRETWKYV